VQANINDIQTAETSI